MAIYRITPSCIVDGQICQNVLHFEHLGSFTLTQLADMFVQEWMPQIRPFQHNSAVWFDVAVRQVSPVGPAEQHKTISLAGTGGSKTAFDVPFCARVIQFRTLVAGRHGRGRMFIPGTSAGSWDSGIIKPVSITAGAPLVQNLKDRFIGSVPVTQMHLVLARRSDPSQTLLVNDIVQRTVLGHMASRGIGRGM